MHCLLTPVIHLLSLGGLTFDLQLAGDNRLTMFIEGLACVHAAIKVTRLADLQRADALVVYLPVLGIITNDHLVLHPLNLRLQREERRMKRKIIDFVHTLFHLFSVVAYKGFHSEMYHNLLLAYWWINQSHIVPRALLWIPAILACKRPWVLDSMIAVRGLSWLQATMPFIQFMPVWIYPI